MNIQIGKKVKQKEGYQSFKLDPFPVDGTFVLPTNILIKAAEADRLLGKLDGITHTLPDVDFFLSMFVYKDAESSAQIEGTKATMVDALEFDAGIISGNKNSDADDISYYINALSYGVKRLKDFPLSLRLIREIHKKLMTGARATHFSDPGEFRKSQNWLGGTTPSNASFVPPTVDDMHLALNDFEKFLYDEKHTLPIIHIAIMHAHFETIHPFLDGNGRTGRLLITMLLCHRNLLERPVLFLSSYFKRYQKVYYQKLNSYHEGDVLGWVEFFLDGVIEIAEESIKICKKITAIREEDLGKIQILGKRESESGLLLLRDLYRNPIITSNHVMKISGFSRPGALKVIKRFISLGILEEGKTEGSYVYRRYLRAFI